MLKNFHMTFASSVSVLSLYLIFSQDLGLISKSLMLDNISLSLSFMTSMCLVSLIFLMIYKPENKYLVLMNSVMIVVFNYLYFSQNLFLFYIMFEISVIPMMFYISSWGYSLARLKAMMYMFMYTFFFSLPFLFIFMALAKFNSMTTIFSFIHLNKMEDIFIILCMFMFLVKIPVWGFHLWLPKAHVEASTEGSMILAGVVLKLAGIGMIKFMSISTIPQQNYIMLILASMSMMGAILMGIYCLRQSDLKMIIALSSIVHMSFLFLCYLMDNSISVMTMILTMVAHGIISPMMFMFLGEVYNNMSSRSINVLKGILKNMLYLSLLWFMLCMFNMGLPISMNFFGEMMFFFSSSSFSLYMTFTMASLIFINGLFNSFLLVFLMGGKEKNITSPYISSAILTLMYMFILFILLYTPSLLDM